MKYKKQGNGHDTICDKFIYILYDAISQAQLEFWR